MITLDDLCVGVGPVLKILNQIEKVFSFLCPFVAVQRESRLDGGSHYRSLFVQSTGIQPPHPAFADATIQWKPAGFILSRQAFIKEVEPIEQRVYEVETTMVVDSRIDQFDGNAVGSELVGILENHFKATHGHCSASGQQENHFLQDVDVECITCKDTQSPSQFRPMIYKKAHILLSSRMKIWAEN